MLLPMGKNDERTEVTATAIALPEPVRVEGERRIKFEFGLTEPEGETKKRKVGVLTCGFRKAGISFATYEPYPTEYYAAFSAETEEQHQYGYSRSFTMFQAPRVGIAREETKRYSAKKLEEFAQGALTKLMALAEEGNPAILRVIEEEP
jgi:hypothetical protein